MVQVNIPVNDSLRVRYSVRLEDRTLLALAGYTVDLTVRSGNSQSAPIVYQVAGVVQVPNTSALVTIVSGALATPGRFFATVRATNGVDSYSETFAIIVVDRA
jgi:hypothetical protein